VANTTDELAFELFKPNKLDAKICD